MDSPPALHLPLDHRHGLGQHLVSGVRVAELIVRRVIQYDEHDETIATFSLAQQYMASEVATGINSDVERGFISPEGARAVLLFLAARLEGK